MTEHSPAAIVAYPCPLPGGIARPCSEHDALRTAYDRGDSDGYGRGYDEGVDSGLLKGRCEGRLVDRGALIQWFKRNLTHHEPVLTTVAETWADALFASGVIHEAGNTVTTEYHDRIVNEAQRQIHELEGQVGKPVVDVEALEDFITERRDKYPRDPHDMPSADLAVALTAPDGPLRDEREVKAEALEEAGKHPDATLRATEWCNDRAAEIRKATTTL